MTKRKRLTKRQRKRQAKREKQADPYQMNQDRDNQYPTEKYMIGGPSAFGEDVHQDLPDDEALGRNEIGMTNMPDWAYDHKGSQDWNADRPYDNADTFSPEDRDREASRSDSNWYEQSRQASGSNWYEEEKRKTASQEKVAQLKKKADKCVDIAKAILGKTASDDELVDQTYDLMSLSDRSIQSTLERITDADALDSMLDESRRRAEEDEEEDEKEEEEEEEDEDEEEEEKDSSQEDEVEAMMREMEEGGSPSENTADAAYDQFMSEHGMEQDTQADKTINEMTGQSGQNSNDLDIELNPAMNTTSESELTADDEALKEVFQESIPEGAKQAQNNSDDYSGQNNSGQDGVQNLGGSVKQASGQNDVDELEKIWKKNDDVSDSF